MAESFEIKIVINLTELDLYPINHEITEQEIKQKYRSFSKVFHPDGNEYAAFQDGEKQKKVNAAKDFLIANLAAVNEYIRRANGISEEEAQRRAKAEAEAKAKAEAEAKAKAEAEAKAKAEAEAKKREAERKKREEERARQAKVAPYSPPGSSGSSSRSSTGSTKKNSSNSSRSSTGSSSGSSYSSTRSTSSSSSGSSYSSTRSSTYASSSSGSSRSSSSSGKKLGWLKKGVVIYFVLIVIAGIVLGIISMAKSCDFSSADSESGDSGNNNGITVPAGAIKISTKEELAAIGGTENEGKSYALDADIDLSGEEWEPIRNFCGWFYGNGHVIKGLTITKFNTDYIGLFSETKAGVSFQGVQLTEVNIVSTHSAKAVGAILGYAPTNVQFKACSVEGKVECPSASMVGGLCGDAEEQRWCYVTNCSFKGSVAGVNSVGGIAGKINGYYTDGGWNGDPDDHGLRNNTVEGTVTGFENVGGLFGELTRHGTYNISNNTNSAAVTGTENVGGVLGKLAMDGTNFITFGGNTNSGDIAGSESAGGIAGYAYVKMGSTESVSGLVNSGNIAGTDSNVGGLFGYLDWKTTLSNCTNTGTFSESTAMRVGGFVGYLNNSSSKLLGLTNTADITAGACVGGIVGYGNGYIENCTNEGEVHATVPKENTIGVGGIAGTAWSVKYCTNRGAVYGQGGIGIGGIAGMFVREDSTIEFINCTNTASIYAQNCEQIGGIIGDLDQVRSGCPATVSGCENGGTLYVEGTASAVGGIIGKIGTCNNFGRSTYDLTGLTNRGDILAPDATYVGGIVGYSVDHSGGYVSSAVNLICEADIAGLSDVGGIFGYYNNFSGSVSDASWRFTGTLYVNGKTIEQLQPVG